ncbi:hypothetical protein EDB85DRAFT_2151243 [Lactarius pseudohatsudake]|nr:hypothetical protein EDB85DRAFT_2151243 [Lactarius pseudohatsudake]
MYQSLEQTLLTGDIGHYVDNPPPPSPPSSPTRRGVSSILESLQGIDPHSDKPQLMAELMDILNYPTPETEGLTPLHWLGLNPLVILGAPAGHYGPSPPPPDLDTLFSAYATQLTDALRESFTSSFVTLARHIKGTSGQLDRLVERLDRLELPSQHPPPPALASIPSSPPSPAPAAAPAQDVEMARLPALAPVPPPAPAPAAPGYPYPYPGKPVPVLVGTGFDGFGYRFLRVDGFVKVTTGNTIIHIALPATAFVTTAITLYRCHHRHDHLRVINVVAVVVFMLPPLPWSSSYRCHRLDCLRVVTVILIVFAVVAAAMVVFMSSPSPPWSSSRGRLRCRGRPCIAATVLTVFAVAAAAAIILMSSSPPFAAAAVIIFALSSPPPWSSVVVFTSPPSS